MLDDLDPKEFEATATAVVSACTESPDAASRADLLAEAGLLGVTAPGSIGGLGLPLDFAVPIVGAAGGGLLAFPLIEAILLAKALAKVDETTAAAILNGETIATIAWNGFAEDGIVGGAPMAAVADRVLIFCADGSAVLGKTGNAIQAEQGGAIDIDAPAALLRLSGPLEGYVLGSEAVKSLKDEAKILRSAFIQGSAAKCLSMAVEYAQDRSQFRHLLSSYQALRHRMSRDAMALETMRNGITRALKVGDSDGGIARDVAWLAAAKHGPAVAESAIQVFGGMGFTWDVPLHRHLRQVRSLAQYGAAAETHETFGDAVLGAPSNEWYGDLPNGL